VGYYWNACNVVNVGGMISCRPGYRCIVELPDGNLQGAAIFRPLLGLEQMVIVIEGHVYVADYPFKNWRMLTNVHMNPVAKQVYWCLAEQSAYRETTELTSAIIVQDPRRMMFIQDGDTAPAWYDGSNSGHLRDLPFEMPVGKSMCWVGDRLWVSRGPYVFASDIANPVSFREQLYLGGVGAFVFSGEVTALAKTPGLEAPQLMVFTGTNGSLVQANIRERSQWTTTTDMQREIFSVGCTSQRSVISHYGQLSWFSQSGQTFLDQAVQATNKSRMPIRDHEMHWSKIQLSADLSLVAGGAFGQFLLMSVPFEDTFNSHTWVYNNASFETISDDSGPSWSGFWTGTRPVEWVYGDIAGSERIYYVSTDEDDKNRLWEAFTPDRLDNGCPITWFVETRGYFGLTSPAQNKLPGADCRFCYADLALLALDEDFDLGVFYAGGLRGAYKKLLSKRFHVTRGGLTYGVPIRLSTDIVTYKSQSRRVRTEDARRLVDDTETGSCPAESDKQENVDESFQLAIVGHGPATIRWIRTWAAPEKEDLSGNGEACQDETGFNAVRFDGAGAHAGDLTEVQLGVLQHAIERYTSNQTTTVDQEGQSVVGVGYAESVISQAVADRVALRVAVRTAENQLSWSLPPVLSVGETL
jgi:hypothetical protein